MSRKIIALNCIVDYFTSVSLYYSLLQVYIHIQDLRLHCINHVNRRIYGSNSLNSLMLINSKHNKISHVHLGSMHN